MRVWMIVGACLVTASLAACGDDLKFGEAGTGGSGASGGGGGGGYGGSGGGGGYGGSGGALTQVCTGYMNLVAGASSSCSSCVSAAFNGQCSSYADQLNNSSTCPTSCSDCSCSITNCSCSCISSCSSTVPACASAYTQVFQCLEQACNSACGGPSCRTDGNSCSSASQCCSGQCNGGVCGPVAPCPSGPGACGSCAASPCCSQQQKCLASPSTCGSWWTCYLECKSNGYAGNYCISSQCGQPPDSTSQQVLQCAASSCGTICN